MKRLYYLIRLLLKRKVKWSFCSGCLCKVWKFKLTIAASGRTVFTCGICDTFSYT